MAFDERVIRVEHPWDQEEGEIEVKTDAGRRTVPWRTCFAASSLPRLCPWPPRCGFGASGGSASP